MDDDQDPFDASPAPSSRMAAPHPNGREAQELPSCSSDDDDDHTYLKKEQRKRKIRKKRGFKSLSNAEKGQYVELQAQGVIEVDASTIRRWWATLAVLLLTLFAAINLRRTEQNDIQMPTK